MNTQADCELIVLAGQTLGSIDGPLWGQFLELTGRNVNGGIHDPRSPRARADGVRTDVLEALAELRPTHIRYPGGCAVAYFDWQELVGPIEQRPRAKLFRYTHVPQSTAFGIPEAIAYAAELGAEMYLALNAHTQSPEDAANLVEYLNATTPTRWADLRRAHGHDEPFNVKVFGLGNEIYGDWQPGQKTAEQYVAWCREAIAQMKAVDPDIQTIAVGCGRPDPEWDRCVLRGLIDCVDMISVHNYCGRPVFADSMAASCVFQQMIDWANVAIDEAMDRCEVDRPRPGIALDEWNVWYRATKTAEADVEEIYDFADALTVASILHVILRNTDTISLANISEAANTLGVLFTDPKRCVRQTIFYPQQLYREKHTGDVVRTIYDGPTFPAKHDRYFMGAIDPEQAAQDDAPTLLHFDHIDALDAVTSIDRECGRLVLSVINKLEDRALATRLTMRGVQVKQQPITVHRLTGTSVRSANTLDQPDEVGLASQTISLGDTFTFPPASLTVLEMAVR